MAPVWFPKKVSPRSAGMGGVEKHQACDLQQHIVEILVCFLSLCEMRQLQKLKLTEHDPKIY